jgi:hypothetical protein
LLRSLDAMYLFTQGNLFDVGNIVLNRHAEFAIDSPCRVQNPAVLLIRRGRSVTRCRRRGRPAPISIWVE